ncbi:hypothetical protein HZA41_02785 [Candidatus Peregrinibacteria bacterium]|nr:hypothetical protein [Candidatus Peregrinibacteria bacterium]
MTKIIGMKELQTKTKKIREDIKNGVHFIVVWRSKPIFEIRPFEEMGFVSAMQSTNLYTEDFMNRMEKAEEDMKNSRIKTFKNTAEFLKSLV